ncbi:MAG TPA: hypothetical protein VJJ46_13165 [Anaerolineales bacterium]|nr:hypothetical protein [Anaerolineales bacterium]
MLGIPSLLMLAGAGLILLARRRHERAWWLIALGTSLVAWLSTLLLLRGIPWLVGVSVWRPEELFASRLELVLDGQGWQLLFASVTLLLCVLITAVERRREATATGRAMMLAYSGLAVLALLAGNLLTVATTWALLDLSAFAFLATILTKEDSARDLVSRLAIDSAGVLLVLGATVAQAAAPEVAQAGAPPSPLSVVLVSLAVLLRLGLFPPHFALPTLPGVRRGLGTLLRLLPAAVALAALGRALEQGVPSPAQLWLRLGGALGVVIGGLRWVSEAEAVGGRRFLVLGLSGLGVLAATMDGAPSGAVLAATGMLVLLVGAAVSLNEIHTRAHRVWIALAALFILGLPATPGALIAGLLLRGVQLPGDRAVASLGILGMFLLGLGTFRRAFAPQTPWVSGESLVRLLYSAGLLLPLLGGIGLTIREGAVLSPAGIVLFGVLATTGALGAAAAQRLEGRRFDRWRRWLGYLDPSPVYAALGMLIGGSMRALRSIGDLIEGEGAMLWTYVVLLIVLLAVLGG